MFYFILFEVAGWLWFLRTYKDTRSGHGIARLVKSRRKKPWLLVKQIVNFRKLSFLCSDEHIYDAILTGKYA